MESMSTNTAVARVTAIATTTEMTATRTEILAKLGSSFYLKDENDCKIHNHESCQQEDSR